MAYRYRLGIDVGGTFTDGLLIDENTGETRIAKVPSTPADPSVGFLAAVERIVYAYAREQLAVYLAEFSPALAPA